MEPLVVRLGGGGLGCNSLWEQSVCETAVCWRRKGRKSNFSIVCRRRPLAVFVAHAFFCQKLSKPFFVLFCSVSGGCSFFFPFFLLSKIHAVGRAAGVGREPRLLDLTWTPPNSSGDLPKVRGTFYFIFVGKQFLGNAYSPFTVKGGVIMIFYRILKKKKNPRGEWPATLAAPRCFSIQD